MGHYDTAIGKAERSSDVVELMLRPEADGWIIFDPPFGPEAPGRCRTFDDPHAGAVTNDNDVCSKLCLPATTSVDDQ